MPLLSRLSKHWRGRGGRGAKDVPPAASQTTARGLIIAWLHLAVLWTFAFAQPLFGVLSDSPEFFVARGNTTADIVLFAIGVTLLPPTILLAIEAIFARLPHVRRALHLIFVAVLSAALVLQLLDDVVGGSSTFLLVAAAVAGLGLAIAYARTRPVPELLTILSPAPIVFLIIFLLISPVSKLVLPQEAADAAGSDVQSQTPVVLIVMDEFDPNMLMNARQRIDRTRYPNFAALARASTWYQNATTAAVATSDAVPALLSSTKPREDSLPVGADYPDNLFTLLGDSHRLRVQETTTELCPERLCGGRQRDKASKRLGSLAEDLGVVSMHVLLPEELRSGLPAVDRTFADFRDGGRDDKPSEFRGSRLRTVDRLVKGIRARPGKPGLHFLHAAFPHVPWQYLPTGQQYLSAGPETPGLELEQWSEEAFPPKLGMQRHLLQVGYTDRLVGRVLERLRHEGLFDRAMVVVTADHGVSFRSGRSRRAMATETRSDIAAVPLFIKYPGQRRGRIDTSLVRNADIVPTIAEELGTPLPWEAVGRPIRRGGPRAGSLQVYDRPSNSVFRFTFVDFVRERTAGLRRMIRLFGEGDGGARLYATGPDADLLGRRVDELATGRSGAGGRVNLDTTDLLANYRSGASTAPSFVTGTVDGVRDGTRLVVAVNGTVRGASVAFRHDEGVRLAVMVPSRSFVSGSNQLGVYAVQGDRGAQRLTALETERPSGYSLVKGGAAIATGERELPIVKGRMEGFIDDIGTEPGSPTFRVGGWAVDLRTGRPVERLVVLDGSRVITDGETTVPRPDLAKRLRRRAGDKPGFRLYPTLRGVNLAKVRVVAISGGVAGELPRFKPKPKPEG